MNSSQKKEKVDMLNIIKSAKINMFQGDEKTLDLIIEELTKYDIYDIIERISLLNLIIENQNKGMLFDILISKILAKAEDKYQGKAKISSGKFKKIIRRIENLGVSQMIDPAENTFIERIRYHGNYWIFAGTNYSPSYSLQGMLNVLCLRKLPFEETFTYKAHQLINFILQLSDGIVKNLGYNMESIVHIERKEVCIPSADKLSMLKKCISINGTIVEELIEDEELRDLLFIEFKEDPLYKINEEFQEFYKRPFLKTRDNDIIILNPSMLVPFVIHQIVLLADKFGCKELLINAYNNELWEISKRDLRKLGHRKIKEAEYGIELINNQYRKEQILTVGNDKLLFVHFVCDAGIGYNDGSMFGQQEVESTNPSIYSRVKEFTEKLPFIEENNFFQVVILNSFGRIVGCEVFAEELGYSVQLTPQELHCIAVNESDKPDFIPRYIRAKSKLNIMTPPSKSSELNAIEIYTGNDNSFYLSDEYDSKNTAIAFPPGDSLDYVIRAMKKEDRQLADSYDGIHLVDVVLTDVARNIYVITESKAIVPELMIKFDNVNIWITTEGGSSEEEINIICSIVDAVSYWLAEAKEAVEQMDFRTRAVRLHIGLSEEGCEYYRIRAEQGEVLSGVDYLYDGNTLNMMWSSKAYRLMGDRNKNGERQMLESMLTELAKYQLTEVQLDTLDDLFSNPLKKKFFEIDVEKAPYMVPISGRVPEIYAEEEHQLLDEIGEYFLDFPEYGYGRVPDEKRVELTNKVVGYLYELLQREVASIKPVGLIEKICFDLEVVLQYIMVTQKRYAYDIACYPEKSEKIFKKFNEANKVSVALKFFAEYVAAIPPKGEKPLSTMQYDRILALCSLIINWAYRNDLFKYNVFNTPVEFLKSNRIGMSKTEGEYLTELNVKAIMGKISSLSDPSIPFYTPEKPFVNFQEQMDEAFADEYGFTFKQFTKCILAIAEYGNKIRSEVKRIDRDILVKVLLQEKDLTEESVNGVIDLISLTERKDFLKPPEPFVKNDVYPWRFNRELSFTRRPIIQNKNTLIWGNRQLHHMMRYTTDLIVEGRFKARGKKLKEAIGKLSNIRGNEFNSKVFVKLCSIDGLIVRERVSKINRKRIKDITGNDLGDIDILYIVPKNKKIVVGEVKAFAFAKNPYEMEQEYKRIFVDAEKPCYMTKHKRRVAWVEEHIEDVKTHFGLANGDWSVKAVMFVNEEIVSNDFYHENENIIVYSQITEKKVKSIR